MVMTSNTHVPSVEAQVTTRRPESVKSRTEVRTPRGTVLVSDDVAEILANVKDIPKKSVSSNFANDNDSIRGRIITPYNSHAFEFFLEAFGLKNQFPFLVHRLRFGFSIRAIHGIITKPIIPEINRMNPGDASICRKYLAEEVSAGRMSGPFTREGIEKVVGAVFAASPIHVVKTLDDNGEEKRRIVRNISYPGEELVSVNDLVDPSEWPTEWGTAACVENIVSVCLRLSFAERISHEGPARLRGS
jgi:hypothetical protein